MKKELLHINKGFSLVEILVAFAVFLVFFIALTDITVSSSRYTRHSVNRERAIQLADEGLEALRNIRDEDITNLSDGTYGLSTSSNQFTLSGSSDTTGIFNRTITISTISSEQRKANINVSWTDQISTNNNVSLTSYLSNWREIINIGLTISKTVINHGGSLTVNDFLPTDLNTTTYDFSVDPPTLQNISIPIIFSPSTMNLVPGTYTFNTTNNPDYMLTLSNDCNGGSIVLNDGDAKLCTITYEEYHVPIVTSPTYASVSTSTATLGANVISLGLPASISQRGICYGTSPNPTTNCTAEGATTTGVFTMPFTGLTINTTYYFRGYATNAKGTGYSEDGTFTTLAASAIPTVTSPTATGLSGTSVTLGANVTSLGSPAVISARGICYGTSPAPVTNCTPEGGTTTGVFTQLISGLLPNTLYYYRGYATNVTGTGYSTDGTFTTTNNISVAVGIPTTYDNNSSNSAVVSKPTGVVQNDIMFAYIGHQNATNVLNSIPTGWTLVAKNDNGSNHQALYYKVAGASEPVSYTFGLSASVRVGVTISAWRGGFDITNPIDVVSNTQYTVNNTTYRAASMNLTYANENVFMFPSVISAGARTFIAPTTQGGGWVEDYDFGNASSRFSRSEYRKLISSSGATGVIDSIGSTAGTTNKHAFAVGLKP
jgi:Tfp pilus assembly protein PilV